MFAEAQATPDFIGYLMQGGALAIMGVFFLFVWPKLEQKRNESLERAMAGLNESARAERAANDQRYERLIDAMNGICRARHS